MKFRRGVRLDNDQYLEIISAINRIATTFEHMHKLHLEWHKQMYPKRKRKISHRISRI